MQFILPYVHSKTVGNYEMDCRSTLKIAVPIVASVIRRILELYLFRGVD